MRLRDSRTPCSAVFASLEICLSFGSPSGRLREPPSCVCWMDCNYPQASLGQCSRAPLPGYATAPTKESPPLFFFSSVHGDSEHTRDKRKVQGKYKSFIKACKQKGINLSVLRWHITLTFCCNELSFQALLLAYSVAPLFPAHRTARLQTAYRPITHKYVILLPSEGIRSLMY